MSLFTETGSRPKPATKFELYAWLFMRLSGILLLFLVLGHFSIMHLINSVDVIDFNFVAGRYGRLLWRVYDLTLLTLAMLHGLNGARILVDEYLKGRWRTMASVCVSLLGALAIIIGAIVIIIFQSK